MRNVLGEDNHSMTSGVRGVRKGLAGCVRQAPRQLYRHPELSLGLFIVGAVLAVVAFPGWFAGQSPLEIDTTKALQPPSAAHWFGTDDIGRDVYARAIFGARVTLGVVAFSLLASAVAGGLLGVLAGHLGKALDMVSGRGMDMILSFPAVILGMIITGILGPGLFNLGLALSLVYLPLFFRVARSGALSEKEKTYVEAARSLGIPETAILARHVLRNVLPLILQQYALLFPLALQIQVALGFLGLGVPQPTPDWGASLEQAKNFVTVAPWMSVYPGLFVLVSASGVILLSRGLQRISDLS